MNYKFLSATTLLNLITDPFEEQLLIPIPDRTPFLGSCRADGGCRASIPVAGRELPAKSARPQGVLFAIVVRA